MDDGALDAAAESLGRFLDRCPPADVREAKRLILALRDADTDADGALSQSEFKDAMLSDLDRIAVVWGVFGTTLAENSRPQYPDAVSLNVLKLDPDLIPSVPDTMKSAIAMSAL